ncbi:MAG: PspA/IM30 family protein [Myxococcota bacterium]
MGILRRISKVLESNLNSLVERAEDPAKLLDQAIDDMKRGQKDAREAIVDARTQKRLLERKRDKALSDADAFERKATQALEKGDEDLARRALELKLAADERAEAEDSAIREQTNQIEQLETAERELARRLSEMPARRAALLARQAAASARGAKSGAANKAQSSVHNALAAFDRMEEKVIRAEVEAEVVGDPSPDLLDAGVERRTRTEDALARLRAKVEARQLGAGTDAGARDDSAGADAHGEEPSPEEVLAEAASHVEPDKVEDSLEALKRKLGKT